MQHTPPSPDSQMLIETVPALLSEAMAWKDTEIDFSRLALDVFQDMPQRPAAQPAPA